MHPRYIRITAFRSCTPPSHAARHLTSKMSHFSFVYFSLCTQRDTWRLMCPMSCSCTSLFACSKTGDGSSVPLFTHVLLSSHAARHLANKVSHFPFIYFCLRTQSNSWQVNSPAFRYVLLPSHVASACCLTCPTFLTCIFLFACSQTPDDWSVPLLVPVVAFSSIAVILEECSTIYSLSALFFFFWGGD